MDDHIIDDFYDDDIKQLVARVVELFGEGVLERATVATRPELRAFADESTVESLMRFQIAMKRELRGIVRPH
jgi:hypothetical protein